MPRRRTTRRGVTLLELLVCMAVVALLAVATSRTLGEGRVIRERAKHRAEMTLLAQTELERMRLMPAGQITSGVEARPAEGAATTLSLTRTAVLREDGHLEIGVAIERTSPLGPLRAQLTAIHPGVRP